VILVENKSNENAMNELKQNDDDVRSSKIFRVHVSDKVNHDVQNDEFVA
jgi:hypothetical protein